MANIEITNNDTTGIVIWEPITKSDTLTVAGAGTTLKGTLLARDSSTLKLIPYVKGGSTNDNGTVRAVLLEDQVATGAGDLAIFPLISGQIRSADLVIAADGDNSNVDAAVLDALRQTGIIARSTTELSELDNQ